MIERFQRFKQPTTVDEAVHILIADLDPQQMSTIAQMDDHQFETLCDRLVPHLQHDFRLWSGNDELLVACFQAVDYNTSTDPMRIIMDRMRSVLQINEGVIIIG